MLDFSLLPNWFIALYVFLFGLCCGSFLNVVILRGLAGEGIVFERSRCPVCKNQLKWYMNIPLVSYLFLMGKCGFCKTRISPQYPIVEFVTASLFLISYFVFGFTFKGYSRSYIACFCHLRASFWKGRQARKRSAAAH